MVIKDPVRGFGMPRVREEVAAKLAGIFGASSAIEDESDLRAAAGFAAPRAASEAMNAGVS